jgi:hypothetical protein
MRSWNAWLLPLGLAGLSLVFAGCGGSNAPDAEPDANAANEPPAAAPAEPAAPPEAPVAAAPDPAAAPAAAEAAEAPAGEAAATEEAKPKDSSAATAEMLALGNKPAGGTAGLEANAANGAAPGDPAAAAAGGGAGQPGVDPAVNPGAPGGAPAGAPGAPGLAGGVPDPAAAAGGADPGAPALAAAGGGEPGTPGDQPEAAPDPGYNAGGGGGGVGNFKEDFHTPFGAVTVFLKALRAKDAEKLMKATALRAPRESKGKNQSLFTKILEQSMTEDELSELANKYQGYNISGNNTPKSTGRFTIILSKRGQKGETYVRTIETRHEKEGWKVVDLGGEGKIPAMMRRFPTRGGMRRR